MVNFYRDRAAEGAGTGAASGAILGGLVGVGELAILAGGRC